MAGIPIDLYPEFPSGENIILLTESAKFDPDIVNKIKGQLVNGNDVVITSGLLRALMVRALRRSLSSGIQRGRPLLRISRQGGVPDKGRKGDDHTSDTVHDQ
jgi:hypothetical protein